MCIRTFNKECDGCQNCKPQKAFVCPVCGEEPVETVFVKNSNGEVIGCDQCANIKEPWELMRL